MHLTATILSISLLCVGSLKVIGAADVEFKLYKRESPTTYSVLKKNDWNPLKKPYFSKKIDNDLPTRIYIHDYQVTDETIDRYREEILNFGNFNFIIVDWKKGAQRKDLIDAKIFANEVSNIFEKQKYT